MLAHYNVLGKLARPHRGCAGSLCPRPAEWVLQPHPLPALSHPQRERWPSTVLIPHAPPVRPGAADGDVNVTPLVDVMLVLLVIFIITAPLLTSAIRLDLPQTPAAQPSQAGTRSSWWSMLRARMYIDDQP